MLSLHFAWPKLFLSQKNINYFRNGPGPGPTDPSGGSAGNLAYWRVSYANVNLRESLAPKANLINNGNFSTASQVQDKSSNCLQPTAQPPRSLPAARRLSTRREEVSALCQIN